MSVQSLTLVLAALSGAGVYGVLASRSQERVASAGFWFEDVSFESSRLGPLTAKTRRRFPAVDGGRVRPLCGLGAC